MDSFDPPLWPAEIGEIAETNRIFDYDVDPDLTSSPNKKSLSDLFIESEYLVFVAASVVGGLYFAPEDISGWKDGSRDIDYGSLTGRYWENITNGPVLDNDNPFINYLVHPYVGAIYYVRARHENYSGPTALFYSFCMSTFVFEYGVEAFFEKPSYQDLATTPVFGAILGEVALNLERHIKQNKGKLFQSSFLGATAAFIMDPLEYIIKPCRNYLRDRFDLKVEKQFFSTIQNNDEVPLSEPGNQGEQRAIGIRLIITRCVSKSPEFLY
ncbi:MAG: DUF3943 domain-containing protein [Desulfobulbaceae bacterium]|nr:DUF3943 domain-containing protein [Desulfobulbaceae bacterium]